MKKLFTIDDFMVAFIAALGYGFGESIARLSGWPEIMCVAASFALGIVLEELISHIIFSKAVQKDKRKRILIFAAILILFLASQYISTRFMGVSMLENLEEEFLYVVGLPILGLAVNFCLLWYRRSKIRELYGDGSEGYVFDLSDEDIEEANRQNQKISGKYDAELAVKTRTGIFVGEEYKETICYLGIPYAKPPVGDLRWKAPRPLPPSDMVFEANNFGASAIQVEHKGTILKNHRQSEDCLYLNICVGSEETEAKKPVIVLFHYGDFTYGGSADPLLYGANYVIGHPDTVLVSFNYRLGIFGFIDFSDVPGGKSCPDALNLGLLDQIAALEWIKENIAAFGGDPDRITAVGFESGATSICMLAACKQAKGLFQRAFVFNGNLGTVYDTPDGSRELANALLKETGTHKMEELMRLKTDELKAAAEKLWKNMCAPTRDGVRFPVDIARAYQDGCASGIEFVIGISTDETGVFRSFLGEENYEKLISAGVLDVLKHVEGPAAKEVLDYIRTETDASGGLEARSKLIEQWNAICIYYSAEKLSEGGSKVHVMYWNEKQLIEKLGSGTVDVAATLLDNSEALQMYGGVMNEDLSETLQSFLEKFVKGKALELYPNEIKGADAFDWEAFPKALIVSDGEILCDTIENRLTEIEGLYTLFPSGTSH